MVHMDYIWGILFEDMRIVHGEKWTIELFWIQRVPWGLSGTWFLEKSMYGFNSFIKSLILSMGIWRKKLVSDGLVNSHWTSLDPLLIRRFWWKAKNLWSHQSQLCVETSISWKWLGFHKQGHCCHLIAPTNAMLLSCPHQSCFRSQVSICWWFMTTNYIPIKVNIWLCFKTGLQNPIVNQHFPMQSP